LHVTAGQEDLYIVYQKKALTIRGVVVAWGANTTNVRATHAFSCREQNRTNVVVI